MNRTRIAVVVACAAALGCPAPAMSGVEVRAAHMAVVPANAEFVAQADLGRVLDAPTVDRWLSLMQRMEEHPAQTACVGPLLARAQVLTDIVLPGSAGADEDALVLVWGDLTAADVVGCAAAVMGGAAPPAAAADGTYVLGEGDDQAVLADVPGLGVAIGTPAGLAAARAAAPAGGPLEAAPAMARLRGLLTPGGDAEAFLLKPMGADEIRVDAAGLSLHRGATDRYELVLLAGSPDAANALSLLAMGLPLMIAQAEQMMAAATSREDVSPEAGEALAALRPILDAISAAFGDAQVTVEGDAVRVVVELDPAKVGPTDLLFGAGVMLFARSAAPAEMPGDQPESDVAPPAVQEAVPATP